MGVPKVSGFDVPVFGFVFEGGLFDVGGEVGSKLARHRSLVNVGMGFEAVEEGFGV